MALCAEDDCELLVADDETTLLVEALDIVDEDVEMLVEKTCVVELVTEVVEVVEVDEGTLVLDVTFDVVVCPAGRTTPT